jgi:ribosomal protein L35
MPKSKPNKGLLKRIKVTKGGKIKLQRAFGRSLSTDKLHNF